MDVKSNCVTVMTRVFESLLRLQLYMYRSGRVQPRDDIVAVTEATVPGAIERPTGDTGLVAPNKTTQNSRPSGDYS